MNLYVAIILGILIIGFIWFLYVAFVRRSYDSLIPEKTDFINTNNVVVKSSKLTQITTMNYTLSIWMKINNWNWNNSPKTIYTATVGTTNDYSYNSFYTTSTVADNPYPLNPYKLNVPQTSAVQYALVLDSSTPTLYFTILVKDYLKGVSYQVPLILTNNFPLQKWSNVIVSVNGGNKIDFYIDGKLISSNDISSVDLYDPKNYSIMKNQKVVVSQLASDTNIVLGGGTPPPDISITRFVRFPYSINPQDAKNMFRVGSGISNVLDYNMNLDLLKNNNIFSSVSLL